MHPPTLLLPPDREFLLGKISPIGKPGLERKETNLPWGREGCRCMVRPKRLLDQQCIFPGNDSIERRP